MPIAKVLILGLGGTALAGATYVGVAFVSGHSANEIPLLKAFAAKQQPVEPPKNVTPTPVADAHPPDPAPKETPPHKPETKPDALEASVVRSFVLPSPFSADELVKLQTGMQAKTSELDERLARVRARETALDERERAIESRLKELQDLQASIDKRTSELGQRENELKHETAKPDAKQNWKEVAHFFVEGEAEPLAERLASFDPDSAAHILLELEEKRAIELVNALPADKYKSILEAYRKLPR